MFECNQLLSLSQSLLTLAIPFKEDNNLDEIDIEHFRTQTLAEFVRFEREAFSKQIEVNRVQNTKYAIAAFIDELVMRSKWQHRHQWMSQPLQLQFFGEHLAGEGFFKRLDTLRQTSPQNIDVLEVYYVCLQLGFEGMYCAQGLEKLMALQVNVRGQIESVRGVMNPALSVDESPKPGIVTQMSRDVPFWVIGSVTAALVFCIYLGFALSIDHQARKALEKIETYYHSFVSR